jgi:hypothetical protein
MSQIRPPGEQMRGRGRAFQIAGIGLIIVAVLVFIAALLVR